MNSESSFLDCEEKNGIIHGRFIVELFLQHGMGQRNQAWLSLPDFDNASDEIDLGFILDMLKWLMLGPTFSTKVHTLFSNASPFVAINDILFTNKKLYGFIKQWCLLAPYLCVTVTNALGYLLKVARLHGIGYFSTTTLLMTLFLQYDWNLLQYRGLLDARIPSTSPRTH